MVKMGEWHPSMIFLMDSSTSSTSSVRTSIRLCKRQAKFYVMANSSYRTQKWHITTLLGNLESTGGIRMTFEELLLKAKTGDKKAKDDIFQMYKPLLVKKSMLYNVFSEDLYQELSETVMECIIKFSI